MDASKDILYEIEADDLPYLLFTVGTNMYGISCEFVRSIEQLGDTLKIAESEEIVRGGVIYQNRLVELVDMRKLLGLDSQLEEFENTVQPEKRIKDHENWVAALEKSVVERTDFMLTDDPHQCAFGKWYYSFKTDNGVLKHQLGAIETPHEAIHNTAKLVKMLMDEQNYESALSAIKEMRATHYKTTLHILSSLREMAANNLKEIYIVIDSGNSVKGLIVDSIVGVELIEETLQMPESMSNNQKHISFLGKRKTDGALVFVLNQSW